MFPHNKPLPQQNDEEKKKKWDAATDYRRQYASVCGIACSKNREVRFGQQAKEKFLLKYAMYKMSIINLS